MKSLFAILCFTALTIGAMAQSMNVSGAFNGFFAYESTGGEEKQSLLDGYELIKKAAAHETTKNEPKTWYYYGHITFLMSQDSVLALQYPEAIYEAADALSKSISLAIVPEAKKFKYIDETVKHTSNVIITLYNRAVDAGKNNNDVDAYKAFKTVTELSALMSAKGFAGQNALAKNENGKYISDAKYYYALYANKLGKNDEAKKLFDELIAENYNSSNLYLGLATMQRQEGKKEESVATLQKGMKLFPQNLALVIEMINIYLADGQETEAIDAMLKAIELDPTNYQLYFVTGVAYGKIKKYDNAVEYYQKALELNPTYADAYNNIGSVYLDQSNEYEQLKADLKISKEQHDEYEKKRMEYLNKAIEALEKSNELKPGNLETMDVLRKLYAKVGDYEKNEKMKKEIQKLSE